MLNFFIGFAFFEFGALCGFFVAALMQTARDGDERAGRSRTENIQHCGIHHKADRPDDSERWPTSLPKRYSILRASMLKSRWKHQMLRMQKSSARRSPLTQM